MKLPTKLRLAAALREAAAQAGPHNAAKYEAFAARAETGEFDDFADTHVCPITQFHNELMAAGFVKFAARVRDGEFDATKEESDAWAASAAGQAAFKRLSPETRTAILGSDPVNELLQTLGDGPVQPQYVQQMKDIVRTLDMIFNGQAGGPGRKTGFILMVFPFNDHNGRCNYMSNGARREDVVTMMKEQIKRFEGEPEVSGNA
jgi:hypothetical protein